MPTKYVRESILEDIQATLEGITTDGGYFFDFDGDDQVQRWRMHGNSIAGQVPIAIIIPDDESEESGPDPFVTVKLPVLITVYFYHTPDSATTTDEYLTRIIGDVKKALNVDYTRNGNAIETRILGNSYFENTVGEAFCGIVMEIEIVYQHDRLDPSVPA